MLKPDRSIQRFLISTPSRLVGEYISDDLIITHSWQTNPLIETTMENPFSRSYYMISFNTPDPSYEEKEVIVYPKISPEPLLVFLSVLFGKQFDYHGPFETYGTFHVPNLVSNEVTRHYKIGFVNHSPRANYSIALNLEHFKIMQPLFIKDSGVDEKIYSIFLAAGKSYLQAIQRYEKQPDSAFLDLITCGEILSNYFDYPDEVMFDENLLKQFSTIEQTVEGGEAIVKNIKSRLFQVSRRFRHTILNLLTPEFFTNSEVTADDYTFAALDEEHIVKRINGAYQLRSSYVHTGRRFGLEIMNENWERQFGKYRVKGSENEKRFIKALNDTPTFKGLERLMRYVLLRFLITNHVITIPPEPAVTDE
ncbi:hypothetical protein ACFPYJ_07695 [Paenibacillus solisilvae]|uniref:Apea-like HEPN domain-containing protein n=1 Tax=Paenibacillus solisilvae TaxID=2486751 RepID=A0ABW0VUA9_9BACL